MAVGRNDLRSSKLLDRSFASDDDPMASMGNLMDVMLVFACGLMIALIARYNVDFASGIPDIGVAEPLDGEISESNVDVEGNGANYVESGTVYTDTVTGERYIVTPDNA